MKKFFQLSAVCMLAVCSFVTIGCAPAETDAPADTPAASSTEGGDADSADTPEDAADNDAASAE